MRLTSDRALFGLACGLALVLLFPFASRADAPVRIGGSGAALATFQALVEALRQADPSFNGKVVPSLGSSGSVKAVRAGALEVAVPSRPLSAEEAQGLEWSEFARTPFVLATGPANPQRLTLTQVADIYTGRHSTWPDGSPIRLILRPLGDSDTTVLGGLAPELKSAIPRLVAREGMIVAVTDQDAANQIERLPGALGTSTLALIQSESRSVRPVQLGGIDPTTRALVDGTYPYYKSFYIVTKAVPSEPVMRFITFLRSADGRRILERNGQNAIAGR